MDLFMGGKYPIVNDEGPANARIERFCKRNPDSKMYSIVAYVTRTGDRGPYRKKEYFCSKSKFRKMAEAAAS